MIREPQYSEQAEAVLAALESGQDGALLNAVADAIDLILEHGDEAEARRDLVLGRNGQRFFKVVIRKSDVNWVIFWRPDGEIAQIAYIGAF